VFRKILGTRNEPVSEQFGMHNKELHGFYRSPNIVGRVGGYNGLAM
jgi:hypothetical protein